jgi:hypothetical protein
MRVQNNDDLRTRAVESEWKDSWCSVKWSARQAASFTTLVSSNLLNFRESIETAEE